MDPIRMIARPMLGGIFVATGMNHIKNPDYGAEVAQGFNDQVLEPVGLGADGPTLMKVHGYVSVVAGAGLALGVAPRLCALALAADVTAVNLTANRFWEQEGEERQGTQIQFLKDLVTARAVPVPPRERVRVRAAPRSGGGSDGNARGADPALLGMCSRRKRTTPGRRDFQRSRCT